MNALEFSRGWFRKTFGLAIVLTPADANDLVSELPDVKATVEQWLQQRGKQAHMVTLSVMATPKLLDSYESVLRQWCAVDAEFATKLNALDVQIDFGDRRGKKTLRTVKLTTK